MEYVVGSCGVATFHSLVCFSVQGQVFGGSWLAEDFWQWSLSTFRDLILVL